MDVQYFVQVYSGGGVARSSHNDTMFLSAILKLHVDKICFGDLLEIL